MFTKRRLAATLLVTALVSCKASETAAPDKPTEDPALTSALQAPIMTDPDLAQQSNAGTALTGGGPPVMELPPIESGPEAVAAAKAEAAKLLGKPTAATPLSSGDVAAAADVITPAQLAKLIRGPGTACADKLGYGAAWSLLLPAALPIYPRGHLQEAAGSDKDGCKLRVASFLTPVAAEDVLAFYAARAKAAGLTVKLSQSDAVRVLEGDKTGLALLIRTRSHSAGVSSVDLVVNGGE